MNVLFEGYPGTGKTSLIYGLASHFDMNIAMYILIKKLVTLYFLGFETTSRKHCLNFGRYRCIV